MDSAVERIAPRALRAIVAVFAVCGAALASAAWQDDVLALRAGGVPTPPAGLSARYVFGWSGIEAADASVRLQPRPGGIWECTVHGGTSGFVRSLWKLDAGYRATVEQAGWRSLTARLSEQYRRYRVEETFVFHPEGVRAWRENTKPGADPARWREFKAPGLRDMAAALLLARSQPLSNGDTLSLAVFPGEGMYLVRAKVGGREKLRWQERERDTIRLSLEIDAIHKDGTTEPHRKFQRGTVWVSDDDIRLPLRVEVKVFIGYVFAELVSLDSGE